MEYWGDETGRKIRESVKAFEPEPTIEERKTGRWVIVESGDTDLYECSLCRNRKTHMTPFCDICGAKMESGDNNGTD